MRLELLPQVGHEVYGTGGWLRFRYNPHYVHPHLERELESGQECRLYPQEERIDPRLCQFLSEK